MSLAHYHTIESPAVSVEQTGEICSVHSCSRRYQGGRHDGDRAARGPWWTSPLFNWPKIRLRRPRPTRRWCV